MPKANNLTIDTSTAGLTKAAKLLVRYAGSTIKQLKAKGVAADTLKALRKARKERRAAARLRRMERAATPAKPKKAASPAPVAEAPKGQAARKAKPSKRIRKAAQAARPSDKHVDALKAAGGKVTKVPAGRRAMVRGEASMRTHGDIPASEPAGSAAARQAVQDARELADAE
jgi:hypothetical protein